MGGRLELRGGARRAETEDRRHRADRCQRITAYPHGVPYPQTLAEGDVVLIDMGTKVGGYRSDITRTYVFGAPCEAVDQGARGVIETAGFCPGYKVPGLPRRPGQGLGLDVHEESFMLKGNRTPLAVGMCFSVEPMLCISGEFGVRLEDIAYMAADGALWFTRPAHSVDAPFAYEA